MKVPLPYPIVFTVFISCSPVPTRSAVDPRANIPGNDGFGGGSGGGNFFEPDTSPGSSCWTSTREQRLDSLYRDQTPTAPVAKLSSPYKPLDLDYTAEQIEKWVDDYKKNVSADEQTFTRYVYIPKGLVKNKNSSNAARVALFKALNSTAFYGDDIVTGKDASDGYGLVFAVDTRSFWGQANSADGPSIWNCIARPLSESGQQLLSEGVISVDAMSVRNFDADRPVSAAQLVYNLLHPNIYNEVIDTPSNQSGLLRMLGISNVDYDSVLAWTAQKQAIVNGPRVSKMIRTQDGRNYWATQDYFSNYEGEAIPYAVGNLIPQIGSNDGWIDLPSIRNDREIGGSEFRASEAWVELKNGLISYYIWGNAHQERGRAEKSFVSDPQNQQNGYLVTGRSCITCHVSGVQRAPSEMNRLIRNNEIADEYMDAAKNFWTSDDVIDRYYDENADRFSAAMKKIVDAVSDADTSLNDDWVNGAGEEPIKFIIDYVEEGFLDD
ncbi:hypothetical protein N9D31_01195 [Oligoflexaceae bacterium]|nr:hypothetical protein [Oligoflexaceae bacterium]